MMNIGNMNFGVNKMEIINHLISMNNTLQNQIEQNNLLIQKLMYEPNMPRSNQNFNNFQQNNNPGFPLNNQAEDYFPNRTGEIINIIMETIKGVKIILPTPKDATINELILAFMKKMKLDENLINQRVCFFYNARKLEKDDKRTVSELKMMNGSPITVLEGDLINDII